MSLLDNRNVWETQTTFLPQNKLNHKTLMNVMQDTVEQLSGKCVICIKMHSFSLLSLAISNQVRRGCSLSQHSVGRKKEQSLDLQFQVPASHRTDTKTITHINTYRECP